jgi:transcriptional regulator GlxA family with amidase domain
MKHISILVPDGDCSLTHIEATHQILSQVNTFLLSMDKPPLFTIQLVGLHHEPHIKKGLFTIYPNVLIKDVSKTDLIIIPAIQGDLNKALELNQPFIPWLIKQYAAGAEIASFCIGSFLLAATGLLNGKHCTTHWSSTTDFRTMFPDAMLVPDKIITDDNGIYCSGGALSFQNLIVYLIEKYAGREIAILTSKIFMIDIDRDSQSPFIIFKGQKEHDDESISRAQEFIEKNFGEKISVEQLSSMVAVSRRNLERRFKKATSNSIIEYVQRVRIEAAKKSLESSRLNVNEVMYNVGYNDMKAFRTTFKKITGISPIEYRNKYNPRLVAVEEQ